MKINELKSFLRSLCSSEQHIPTMIWSPPGIGKSSAVKQIAEENKWDFIDLRLSLLNPVDLRGLPFINKEAKRAEWLPPDFLPNGKTKSRGILFLDEINLAPASVMAAGYQLILDRRLGNYQLPAGWKIVAAGNRAEDQANVTKFPAPLSNRFIHVEMESDIDDWRKWAINTKISEQIIAFLSKMPQHLFRMPKAGEKSFPTPRSWENASKLHSLNLDISPAVSEGVAAEFNAFLGVYKKLPDVQAVLEGKETRTPNHLELDVLWALCIALAVRVQPQHFANLFKYISKLPKEFEVLTIMHVSDVSEKMDAAIINSPEWLVWIKKNKSIIDSEDKIDEK